MINEITQRRIELLGTSFTFQHSDSRILEQLIYKWIQSKTILKDILITNYNKFTSDITLEIDGITNGFAMTLLQFPMKSLGTTLERRLNQVGVYLNKFARHREDDTYATDNP